MQDKPSWVGEACISTSPSPFKLRLTEGFNGILKALNSDCFVQVKQAAMSYFLVTREGPSLLYNVLTLKTTLF